MDVTAVRYTPPSSTQVQAANASAAAAPEPKAPQAVKAPVKAVEQTTNDQANQQADDARREAVERAVRAMQATMPDMETFTIFKNTTGEYVTRITNHSSGTVRYVPEQTMLQYLTAKDPMPEGVLALDV